MDLESTQLLRRWAKRVLVERGWDRNQWAKAAGVDASTIHRILARADYAPRFSTLERLCTAAGSRPDMRLDQSVNWYSVPLMCLERLREGFATNGTIIPTMGDEGEIAISSAWFPAFACTITTESSIERGFCAGDTVVCQPITARIPRSGDLVAIDLLGPLGISVGRYEDGLVHHEPRGKLDQRSRHIFGVTVQLIRHFAKPPETT